MVASYIVIYLIESQIISSHQTKSVGSTIQLYSPLLDTENLVQ